MEKDNKSTKTIALIAVFAISLVLLGAALFYSLRTPSNEGIQNQPTTNNADNQAQQQPAGNEAVPAAQNDVVPVKDNSASYQGQTLIGDEKYVRGIFDGTVKSIDAAGNTITYNVDVKKIFPQSPVDTKTVTINAKGAEVVFFVGTDKKGTGSLSDIKVGEKVSIALKSGQTNRSIFDKDSFDAIRLSIFN